MTAADQAKNLADQLEDNGPPVPGNGTPAAVGDVALPPQPPPTIGLPPQPTVTASAAPPAPQKVQIELKQPSARRSKATNEELDALPKTGSAKLNKILPNTLRFRFWRIDDVGEPIFIKDYDQEALQGTNYDVPSFIQKHLVPHHGEGRYRVGYIDTKGNIQRPTEFNVMAAVKTPPPMTGGPGGGFPVEFFDKLWQRMERLEDAARTQKDEPDFLTQFQRMQELMGGKGTDPMMMMMMMQMNQSKSSPLSAELAALKADLKSAAAAAAPPPALPPMPAADTITGRDLIAAMSASKSPGALEILQAVTPLLPAIKEMFGGNQTLMAEIQRLREENANQRLQTLIDEIKEMKSKPARGVRDVLEDTRDVLQLAQQIGGGSEPTFMSVLQTFAENAPDMSKALGGLVERVREVEAEKQGQHRQRLQQAANVAGQMAAGEQSQPQPREVVLPQGFKEVCAKIEDAQDPGTRLMAVIESLMFLGKNDKRYEPHVMEMFVQAKKGNVEQLQKLIKSYLQDLTTMDFITSAGAAQAYADLEEYSDIVIEQIQAASGVRSSDATVEGDDEEDEEPEAS